MYAELEIISNAQNVILLMRKATTNSQIPSDMLLLILLSFFLSSAPPSTLLPFSHLHLYLSFHSILHKYTVHSISYLSLTFCHPSSSPFTAIRLCLPHPLFIMYSLFQYCLFPSFPNPLFFFIRVSL